MIATGQDVEMMLEFVVVVDEGIESFSLRKDDASVGVERMGRFEMKI